MTVLAEKARLSVVWTTGFTVFRDLLQFGLTLTLTRLLPHEAYGYFGFVTAVIGFFTVISFREFLNYTLQVRTDDETHYQDHFTAGVVIQGALFLLVNGLALGLRFVPTYAPVAPLLHVMSLLLPIDLVCELRTRMLERSFDWQRQRMLHAVGLIAGTVVALTLGLSGAGAYALLVPGLIIPLPFAYDLFVKEGWRPTWAWSWERYRPAQRFGLTRIGSASLVSLSTVAESGLMTRAIGFAQLGVYNRAVGLAAFFCQRVAALLLEALYPVITRVQARSGQFRRVSALVMRSVAWVVLPMAVVLSWTGESVVRFLYGPRWLSVLPLLPWTMWLGAMIGLVQTCYVLLLAHQQQRHCFIADALRLGGTLLGLVVALPLGLRAYLIALLMLQSVIMVMALIWLSTGGAMSARSLLATFVPPIVGSALSLAAASQVVRWTGLSVGAPWIGVMQGGVFCLMYLVFLRACCSVWMRELITYLPQRQRISFLLRLPATA
jgi:O-antigen/teichoic acid export membrane protein